MMQQYLNTKREYQNCILFYRLGDFYEMFFEDAKLASRELELTLTGRECGQAERAPMCGVPYHSVDTYIQRLIAKGYKVAICEQMEDPATAKGLVKREIVRVVTPGTVIESDMLDEGRNNYLCAVYYGGSRCGMCFADISTGEAAATVLEQPGEDEIRDELARYQPREVIFNADFCDAKQVGAFIRDRLHANAELRDDACFAPELCAQKAQAQFGADHPALAQLESKPEAMRALGALLGYLEETQRTGIERLQKLTVYEQTQYMRLDLAARRNLELTETMRTKEKRGSLLWVLDRTKTAMGKRLIRTWVTQPLMGYAPIIRRHDAVEALTRDPMQRQNLIDTLAQIFDMERLMTRVVYGTANGRDLRSLCAAARQMPTLHAQLEPAQAPLLQELRQKVDGLEDVADRIDRALEENPPVTVREGKLIRRGYSSELDELTDMLTNGQQFMAQIEANEREATGIKGLKVGYNRVFGYYIEISNANKAEVPASYIRKQTLTNCERYITPELKELENKILSARERSVQLEYELFDQVRRFVAAQLDRVQNTAQAVAQLDVLCSFAEVAARNQYCRPQMNVEGRIALKNSRHPVVEALLNGAPFVPNDVALDSDENRVAIITGPNMAGKSTYMRQTALACLMAQCGSFVPADQADLCLLDGIYTRVGASDDLTAGQSTFMVEMTEMAEILRSATANSLLLLDEIGRGTSTYDGMSIARAVLEYVADKRRLGAKTLFATHYHELTAMEGEIAGVKNYNIAVKKHGDDITFLRRIVRGGADDSFGIEVAKLAGLPDRVIARAKKILQELEQTPGEAPAAKAASRAAAPAAAEPDAQLTLAAPAHNELIDELKAIDVNVLSPIEAMNKLYELKCKAQAL